MLGADLRWPSIFARFNVMVNYSPEELDTLFSALSDPTRRAILQRLSNGKATVTDLAAPFEVSLPAISKHLRVLERAGLMRREIRGREHHCYLRPQPLKDAADWLGEYRQYWEMQLDALGEFLDSEK